MKSKKKIGLIIVLVIFLLAIILGYTFSKYTESISASTSTSVAKWNFTGKITNSANSTSTISLADTVDSETVEDGKIAPGTSGEFDIVIDATDSEVDIDYTIELVDEESKPTNLIFTYADETYNNLSDLILAISSGTISKNGDQVVTYTIGWEWPYETVDGETLKDDVDLEDGQNIENYIFTIEITGTQKKS